MKIDNIFILFSIIFLFVLACTKIEKTNDINKNIDTSSENLISHLNSMNNPKKQQQHQK